MNDRKTLIFCDFDGTVAKKDIGYNFFYHFSEGKNMELIPHWKAGQLTSRDCLLQEAAMVRAGPEEIYNFLDLFEIDPGFPGFVELCRKNDIEPIILSDGFDFYINHVLRKYHLAHLPLYCNIGRLENKSIKVEFPYENHTCPRCGNCKGERMAEIRSRMEVPYRTVFIGDGLSDICAIEETDLLFAKKDLERYCLENNIPYNKYRDFDDVARQLLADGHLKE
ncbi:MAG: MtnX-like HAD-IB family phosphatase [candidate division Zixibacteria bacterium]|nr:MtnX-like HAD-IB family phosphatase [candidate division Zixibacteria bacterium]